MGDDFSGRELSEHIALAEKMLKDHLRTATPGHPRAVQTTQFYEDTIEGLKARRARQVTPA